MTTSQRLTIALSEHRQKINDLLAVETRDEGQQTDLETRTAAIQKMEPELRAAIAAEGSAVETTTAAPLDAEAREKLELRGRATLGGFLLSALQGRVPSGAEAEYGAAFGVRAGEIPIDLWEGDRPAPVEHRAATPAPATGTGVTVAPVQPFVFAPSIGSRLGIDMPSVPSGAYTEMTVSTALPAAPKAKGVDADDTAAALTPQTASPRRISARMSVTLEDIAAVGQANFESALRQNVSMSLSDEYDDQIINGNGTTPNINGLINQLTDPTDPGTTADFAAFLASASESVDGLWASMLSEVAIVANVDAYRLSATVFRANSSDLSFSDYAREALAGWWTNKRMPATASMIARAIVFRMGRPGLRTACCPTWGSVGIDDRYTDSRSGVTHFSVHTLIGDKVLLVQPDAYSMREFKVA